MSDFLKIFLILSAIVSAFLFGRSHGERNFRESAEFKEIAKTKDELGYAKNELENAKAKLQNIVDSADTKRTDELLGQILQVFLADLGLRIQNQEMILKQAQRVPARPLEAAPGGQTEIKSQEATLEIKKAEPAAWTKAAQNKFKSFEWMLENSDGTKEAFRNLEKLKLKNLRQAAGEMTATKDECDNFLGTYRGSIRNINRKRFGSLVFEFRSSGIDGKEGYSGAINWFNEANSNSLYQKVENHCGKKISGLAGRVFDLTANRFIQVYKINNTQKLAGNFYEVLPNRTTNLLGAFVLGRTDIIQ